MDFSLCFIISSVFYVGPTKQASKQIKKIQNKELIMLIYGWLSKNTSLQMVLSLWKIVSSFLRILYVHPMKYAHKPLLAFLLKLLNFAQSYPLPNFISSLFFTIDKPLSQQDLQISTQLKSGTDKETCPFLKRCSQLVAIERGKLALSFPFCPCWFLLWDQM